MSKDRKAYRTLSEEEIRDYLAGEISGREAHELERRLLNNPFEQEAMEGFEQNIDAFRDLDHLREKVRGGAHGKPAPWARIAAAVVVFMVSVSVVWWYLDSQKTGDVMVMKEEVTPEGPKDQKRVTPPKVPEKQKPEKSLAVAKEPQSGSQTEMFSVESSAERIDPQPQGKKIEADPPVPEGQGYLALESEEESTFDLNEEIPSSIAAEPIGDQRTREPEIELREAEPVAQSLQGKVAGVSISRSMGAPNRISGLVTDETGEPLPGVNVIVKGSTMGTVTDINGKYQIPVTEKEAVLQFSFIGMESAETPVDGKSEVNMELESDVSALSEVVVVGYGESKKEGITGAVATIDTKELTNNYERPQPSGGLDAFKAYLESALVYPEEAKEKEIEGKVVLKLIIDATGEITDIEVRRSVGYGCDDEAIRLIKEGPEWQAAKRGDETIESTVRVKVKFDL